VLIGIGVAIGITIGRAHSGHAAAGGDERWPGAAVGFVAVIVIVGLIATAMAYRRIAAPASDLLEAARRIGAGDDATKVTARGPRELRALIDTFNDMSEKLRAADEHRRRFLADVTHELRTPLAVLQSSIEAQVDGIHPRDDAHLHSLLDETQVLGRIVDDLHTLALADAGRLTLHVEPIDPAGLASEAAEATGPLASAKGIEISVEASASAPAIDADPTRVRQVLVNLLSNAIRHTPAGSTAAIHVSADADWVTFSVCDTGFGIPEDQLDAVFDRYTKAADSGGSGLGLTIARDLVVAHGGTIEARNRATGGAEISFRLPRKR
jgi:signal transduction histidine kinase